MNGSARGGDAGAVQRAALEWQVTLWSGEVKAEEQQAFERWLAADAAHRQAWQQVQQLGRQLRVVPRGLAGQVLRAATAAPARGARRQLLRGLTLLAGAGFVAGLVRQTPQWQVATAEHRSARGERSELRLPDGTQLSLNTASAADTRYTAHERRLRLHAGEIHVTTAVDIAATHRPFIVETRAGSVRALGTRFTVRQLDDAGPATVRVQVFEGAVQITPEAGGPAWRLDAGWQMQFTRLGVDTTGPADVLAAAWSRGLLVVERMRLADFLAELGRYRAGVLRCDAAVAALVVSGVFRLDDTDAVLQSLVQALPVRVQMHTHYWVDVTAL